MTARDQSFNTKNYEKLGGNAWHIGDTLELGDNVVLTIDANNNLVFTGLPTADPHVVGALWANAAVLTISAG